MDELAMAPMAPIRPGSFPGLAANNLASVHPYIVVSPAITLFQQQPALAHSVQLAVERAIQEIVNPVVDRSVRIACISCHRLVGKDYATEPQERRLASAAHSVAQHLAGSLAMATAIDPLRASIGSHLRTLLQAAVPSDQKRSQQQIEHLIDQAVSLATPDNLNLACVFVEQTARARAVPAIDEALAEEVADRRRYAAAAAAGTPPHPYRDPLYPQLDSSLSSQFPPLPPQLRPAAFGLDERQLSLYENFTRTAAATGGAQLATPAQQQAGTDVQPQTQTRLPEAIVADLERAAGLQPPGTDRAALPATHAVPTLVRELQAAIAAAAQGQARFDAAARAAQALVHALLRGAGGALLADVALLQLAALHDAYRGPGGPGAAELAAVVSRAARDALVEGAMGAGGRLASPDGVARLLRARLLDSRELDAYLVGLIDQGRSYAGVVFAEELLQRCLLAPAAGAGAPNVPTLSPADFPQALQVLRGIATHSKPPRAQTVRLLEGIAQALKSGGGEAGGSGGGAVPPSLVGGGGGLRGRAVEEEPDDPPGLREQVGYLFEEWLRLATSQPSQQGKTEKATVIYITRLISTMLKTDDVSTRFFRLCADYAVNLCYAQPLATPGDSTEGQAPTLVSYQAVDAFAKLVLVLLRHFGEPTRVALLRKVLATTAAVLQRAHDAGPTHFNQRPFSRLLAALLRDVQAPDEASNHQVLAAFGAVLHRLRPVVTPGFTFSWLSLVANRHFMPALLMGKAQQERSWAMLQALLVDLFTFLQPHMCRTGEMAEGIRTLYKGTLRVLLVLLHDFPEFLCAHHFSLCDAIPPACIQARNLVLSAFPRNMRLPDPFTPNLKVDLLPEIAQAPSLHPAAYLPALQAAGLQPNLDHYLRTRAPVTFLLDLRSRLMLPSPADGATGEEVGDDGVAGAGTRYNVSAINALVLHVGVTAIEQAKASADAMTHGAPMDVFQHLAVDLDAEGRYILLNAVANHLRYPNSHTHYFSCVLLQLFAEANKDVIQEQITRVLLERLIVNRPHPWGLLITFIELIKNRAYKFWSHDFVRCGTDPPGPFPAPLFVESLSSSF